ncbi:class I SAM-dependent methyltransferase [Ilumatobacter sp.]|uniref:class I SAM-dependent methyltransferase n=1 Tax=Ilumatobacter sp. TaxID=1967498 RepID=UPI003C577009
MAEAIVRELREFYEHEAIAGSRGPATGPRVDAASAFVSLLLHEQRSSLLDLGAGPATDAAVFAEADVAYVGIDLAVANGVLADRKGHRVLAASLFDLPFRSGSFDAGWSMSTLMHVPGERVARAMSEIVRPLRPGAPLAIGLWGGPDRDIIGEPDLSGARRVFSLRSAAGNRELLAAHGAIERWEVWDAGPDDWEYHFAVLRLPAPSTAPAG